MLGAAARRGGEATIETLTVYTDTQRRSVKSEFSLTIDRAAKEAGRRKIHMIKAASLSNEFLQRITGVITMNLFLASKAKAAACFIYWKYCVP